MELVLVAFLAQIAQASPQPLPINWGFATSAYQIEGAYDADGKGLSVWDKWFLDGKKILPQERGATPAPGSPFVTADHYNKMKSDIGLLGQLNATAYRFSVSWPRIFPNCNGQVNQAGIQFYSNMIDEILRNGAEPILTLFHWDTPQACHDSYQSWISPRIIDDFTNYADVIFQNFGDRVSRFLTINEPGAMCGRSYGVVARNDPWIWPPAMNISEKAKYDCVQNVILAHASVVNLARRKYADKNFKFGLPLIIEYGIPFEANNPNDVTFADRTTTSQSDWVWGPLVTGDYPAYLRTLDGSPSYNYFNGTDLPTFTDSQKASIKGTLDFLAINYYSASYRSASGKRVPSLPTAGATWQNLYPQGLRAITKLLHGYYNNLEIMISECGTAVPNEMNMTIQQRVNDTFRINFFNGITQSLSDAILIDKTPIKTFLAWSLMDNLEWLTFDQMWGVVVVDQTSPNLTRTVKNSAKVLSTYFNNSVSPFKLASTSNGPATGSNAPSYGSKRNSAVSMAPYSVSVLIAAFFL